jgi:hypothetical protein
LFSGPVETQEEIDKLPPEVRQRYDKLEQKDLPAIAPNQFVDREDENDEENENDNDNSNDEDNDNDNGDNRTDVSGATMEHVSLQACPRSEYALNVVLI